MGEYRASDRNTHLKAECAGEPLNLWCNSYAKGLGNRWILLVPFCELRHEEEKPEESLKSTNLEKGNWDFHSCAFSFASEVFNIHIPGSVGRL